MFGINDFYFHEAGSRTDLLVKAGLTVEKISQMIIEKMSPPNTCYEKTQQPSLQL
jgi:hypothetical protein